MRRRRKNGISRARAIPGKKVTGRERGKGEGWAGQKAHEGGLGDGVAEASRALSETVVTVAVLSASRGIHQRVQLYNVQFDHGPRFPICHTTKTARSWEKLGNVSQGTSRCAFCAPASLCGVHLRMLDGPYPGVHQGML